MEVANRYTKRGAFTMIELILVIVILGIVASLGSEMIAKTYQGYIVQRAQHRASIETELAALQIANRLEGAIPGTVVRRSAINAGTIEDVNDAMTLAGDQYIALQWVGADMDSFNAAATPGWSGFCDLDVSSGTSISTPDSNLTLASTIIGNLGGAVVGSSLYFPDRFSPIPKEYAVTGVGGTAISTTPPASGTIREHYKLAWSSYALVVLNNDLYLYYDFTPTRAINIGGSRSLLMEDISTFKFKGEGRTIRFKICKQENIGEDFNVTSCKEKAVF